MPTCAADVYSARLQELKTEQRADRRRDRLFGVAKLGTAVCGLGAGWAAVYHPAAALVAAAAVIGFVALVVLHERVLRRLRERSRRIAFSERGVARLDGTWNTSGETGERFFDAAHLYARDLDIFGVASLFQYLCNAKTRAGEQKLGLWLLEAAAPATVVQRQNAVKELSQAFDLRESLYSAAEHVRKNTDEKSVAEWGERESVLSAGVRLWISALGLAWIASVCAWAVYGQSFPFLLISLFNFGFSHFVHARSEKVAEGLEHAAADLRVLAEVLGVVERQQFAAERLVLLKGELTRSGAVPSVAIKGLARLAEWVQSRHSLFMRPLDYLTFWSAQVLYLAEGWRRKHGRAIRGWMDVVAEVEALASLAAMAFEHPDYAYPEFAPDGPPFAAEGIGHPLLTDSAITNDVRFDSERALMILSGPNMAGKSTFIRSVGVIVVLAQCGAPVRARRLQMSQMRVGASICVLDSLSGGVSRFYAEILRLKAIDDLTRGEIPVLFLLDELLSGTNSHDRLQGTEFVLQRFVERGAIGIVSTHDLALSRIPDKMNGRAWNAHFEDRVEDGRLVFDYKLKDGVVQTSNALKLMRAVGLGVPEPS